jgi:uridylate kinase
MKSISKIVAENETMNLVIVAGGGPNARKYINAGLKLGLDQASLDELGISISRANAQVVIAALGKLANSKVPSNLSELSDELNLNSKNSRMIVCGGFHPGQSTNAVAALIAEKIRGRFVNATDVDGVYNKDPKRFQDAKFLKSVSTRELSKILSKGSMGAGGYDLMDPVALNIIARSGISSVIVRCDPNVIAKSLLGIDVRGTTILP